MFHIDPKQKVEQTKKQKMKQMLKNNKKAGVRNKNVPRPYENETVKILELLTGDKRNRKPATPTL